MSIDSRLQSYGKVFGDWTIREQIGHGSSGKSAVFLLVRKNLTYEEKCVMKVINILEQRGNYEELSESFRKSYEEICRLQCEHAENEVRLMYGLRGSGNIVDYLDYHFEKWDDGIGFGVDLLIRMELLNSLGDQIRKRAFQEEEIVRIGADLCRALTNCHSRGIIHRDIKPDNIFYTEYGMYMLGDFGISKMMEGLQHAETQTGTQVYAAPEQFRGEYDIRVDIYSLGLTLYQLANANRLPFADSEFLRPQDIQRRLVGEALPKPEYAGERLAGVILKACAWKKEDRYQTASEFQEALLGVMGDGGNLYCTNISTQEDLYATRPALNTELPQETVPSPLPDPVQSPKEEAGNHIEKSCLEVMEETSNVPFPAVDEVEVGRDYAGNGDYENAISWFKKGVSAGSTEAMYELAMCYMDGKGVPKEEAVALNLFLNYTEKCTDRWTKALAKFRIGQIYENGYGGKEGRKEAEKWFRESASEGNPYAAKKFRKGKYIKG